MQKSILIPGLELFAGGFMTAIGLHMYFKDAVVGVLVFLLSASAVMFAIGRLKRLRSTEPRTTDAEA